MLHPVPTIQIPSFSQPFVGGKVNMSTDHSLAVLRQRKTRHEFRVSANVMYRSRATKLPISTPMRIGCFGMDSPSVEAIPQSNEPGIQMTTEASPFGVGIRLHVEDIAMHYEISPPVNASVHYMRSYRPFHLVPPGAGRIGICKCCVVITRQ